MMRWHKNKWHVRAIKASIKFTKEFIFLFMCFTAVIFDPINEGKYFLFGLLYSSTTMNNAYRLN